MRIDFTGCGNVVRLFKQKQNRKFNENSGYNRNDFKMFLY